MRLRLTLSALLVATLLLANGDDAAAGGGRPCSAPAPVAAAAETKLAMAKFCFEPGVVTVAPGETVQILNEDPVVHNVYGPGWAGGDVAPGEVLTRTFDEPGTYTFACTLHPAMTGAVLVGDTEPIAATRPAPDDGDTATATLVLGIGVALLTGLGTGWLFGLIVRHRARPTA